MSQDSIGDNNSAFKLIIHTHLNTRSLPIFECGPRIGLDTIEKAPLGHN